MNSSWAENYFSGAINKGVKFSGRSCLFHSVCLRLKLLCVVGGGGLINLFSSEEVGVVRKTIATCPANVGVG